MLRFVRACQPPRETVGQARATPSSTWDHSPSRRVLRIVALVRGMFPTLTARPHSRGCNERNRILDRRRQGRRRGPSRRRLLQAATRNCRQSRRVAPLAALASSSCQRGFEGLWLHFRIASRFVFGGLRDCRRVRGGERVLERLVQFLVKLLLGLLGGVSSSAIVPLQIVFVCSARNAAASMCCHRFLLRSAATTLRHTGKFREPSAPVCIATARRGSATRLSERTTGTLAGMPYARTPSGTLLCC
jgi:hypothetical protein